MVEFDDDTRRLVDAVLAGTGLTAEAAMALAQGEPPTNPEHEAIAAALAAGYANAVPAARHAAETAEAVAA